MRGYDGDPDSFVDQNRDALIRILKQSDDEFVRALAIAALTEYGSEPDIEDVERELKQARDRQGESE